MSGYMVQVRTSGRGVWAGMSTQGRWVPACVGALNETGRSDAFASTFDTDKEAIQIMREMREGGGADAYTDFRVEKVPDGDPPDPRAWSNDPAEVDRVEAMLTRAGILHDKDTRKDYRSAPWHWTKERASCDVLEGVMRQAHVLPENGWEMTMLELLEKQMEEES